LRKAFWNFGNGANSSNISSLYIFFEHYNY
jgi:hypothetical protein